MIQVNAGIWALFDLSFKKEKVKKMDLLQDLIDSIKARLDEQDQLFEETRRLMEHNHAITVQNVRLRDASDDQPRRRTKNK